MKLLSQSISIRRPGSILDGFVGTNGSRIVNSHTVGGFWMTEVLRLKQVREERLDELARGIIHEHRRVPEVVLNDEVKPDLDRPSSHRHLSSTFAINLDCGN